MVWNVHWPWLAVVDWTCEDPVDGMGRPFVLVSRVTTRFVRGILSLSLQSHKMVLRKATSVEKSCRCPSLWLSLQVFASWMWRLQAIRSRLGSHSRSEWALPCSRLYGNKSAVAPSSQVFVQSLRRGHDLPAGCSLGYCTVRHCYIPSGQKAINFWSKMTRKTIWRKLTI